jgi:hypothetical protein
MWRWIASFGESYFSDVLQYPKQLFSLRLPQMTKYCIMRECDNIHSWISTTGDLAFSHQQEFTVLVFGDLFLRSHSFDSFLSFTKLKHPKTPTFGIDALSLCIPMAQCLARSQTFSHGADIDKATGTNDLVS